MVWFPCTDEQYLTVFNNRTFKTSNMGLLNDTWSFNKPQYRNIYILLLKFKIFISSILVILQANKLTPRMQYLWNIYKILFSFLQKQYPSRAECLRCNDVQRISSLSTYL